MFNGWSTNGTAGTGVTVQSAESRLSPSLPRRAWSLTASSIPNPFVPSIIGAFNGLVKPSPHTTRARSQRAFQSRCGMIRPVSAPPGLQRQILHRWHGPELYGGVQETTPARRDSAPTDADLFGRAHHQAKLQLSMHLDMNPGGTNQITGTLTQKSATGEIRVNLRGGPSLLHWHDAQGACKFFGSVSSFRRIPWCSRHGIPKGLALPLRIFPRAMATPRPPSAIDGTVSWGGNSPMERPSRIISAFQVQHLLLFQQLYPVPSHGSHQPSRRQHGRRGRPSG